MNSYSFNTSVCFRYIQSTCATSGEGLYEGLDWLSNNIASKASSILFNYLFQLTKKYIIINIAISHNWESVIINEKTDVM